MRRQDNFRAIRPPVNHLHGASLPTNLPSTHHESHPTSPPGESRPSQTPYWSPPLPPRPAPHVSFSMSGYHAPRPGSSPNSFEYSPASSVPSYSSPSSPPTSPYLSSQTAITRPPVHPTSDSHPETAPPVYGNPLGSITISPPAQGGPSPLPPRPSPSLPSSPSHTAATGTPAATPSGNPSGSIITSPPAQGGPPPLPPRPSPSLPSSSSHTVATGASAATPSFSRPHPPPRPPTNYLDGTLSLGALPSHASPHAHRPPPPAHSVSLSGAVFSDQPSYTSTFSSGQGFPAYSGRPHPPRIPPNHFATSPPQLWSSAAAPIVDGASSSYSPVTYDMPSSDSPDSFYGSLLVAETSKPSQVLARMSDALFFFLDARCPFFRHSKHIEPAKYSWFLRATGSDADTAQLVEEYGLQSFYNLAAIPHQIVTIRGARMPILDRRGFLHMLTFEVRAQPDTVHKDFEKYLSEFALVDPATGRPFPAPIPRAAFPAAPDPDAAALLALWLAGLAKAADQRRTHGSSAGVLGSGVVGLGAGFGATGLGVTGLDAPGLGGAGLGPAALGGHGAEDSGASAGSAEGGHDSGGAGTHWAELAGKATHMLSSAYQKHEEQQQQQQQQDQQSQLNQQALDQQQEALDQNQQALDQSAYADGGVFGGGGDSGGSAGDDGASPLDYSAYSVGGDSGFYAGGDSDFYSGGNSGFYSSGDAGDAFDGGNGGAFGGGDGSGLLGGDGGIFGGIDLSQVQMPDLSGGGDALSAAANAVDLGGLLNVASSLLGALTGNNT